MAQLTINVPDEQVPRVVEAIVMTLDTDAEPELVFTPARAKELLVDHIKSMVVDYERTKAIREAEEAAVEAPDPGLS